ncbi:uncharacterized protein MONBRDRAFT_23573 [Monosiga brevicollis MX1]|uniref:Phosphoribulokinase/uridine kinase domain-containing protein n=1 Tax=Monosiga brevicollis TaxID=81824 RepID=A9UTU6_MONBE|nr:uncharacterized protein MONBRDRAFT_23573 [Monosiga brevicollis MX1]EDQ91308.1 predicted protein [Monosiga brevicollis MX1]|eukprot:XP_001743730.1 hypothetical protein [Monosiga brevicollis MX1]
MMMVDTSSIKDGPVVPAAVAIAVVGVSCSGKSTVCARLHAALDLPLTLIAQDDFYLPVEAVPDRVTLKSGKVVPDFDSPSALFVQKLVTAVRAAKQTSQAVIVEGSMLAAIKELVPLIDAWIMLDVPQAICAARRRARVYEEAPDPVGYFEEHAYPTAAQSQQRLLQAAPTMNCPVFRVAGTEDVPHVVQQLVHWSRNQNDSSHPDS